MTPTLTVAFWQNFPEESFWLLLEGDKRHWDEQFINTDKDEHLVEMLEILFDNDGNFTGSKISREEAEASVQKGAFLISCGAAL